MVLQTKWIVVGTVITSVLNSVWSSDTPRTEWIIYVLEAAEMGQSELTAFSEGAD